MPISSVNTRIAIVIASTGRPEALAQWKERIAAQTRAPDAFVYSVTGDADMPPESERVPGALVLVGPKGATFQRNTGIEAVIGDHDVIAFFDDDYLPSVNMVDGIHRLFSENPEIISANGTLLADGINSMGISTEDALEMIAQWDAVPHPQMAMTEHEGGLYGCNMAFRSTAIGDERFDENLPLYAWQEDNDFGARMIGKGRTVITDAFVGVHQGTKRGRTSGLRLGYSQVANPAYLVGKGTMSFAYAMKIISRNVLMNHAKAFRAEPWVDRVGRARGNRMAMIDVILRRAHPNRVHDL